MTAHRSSGGGGHTRRGLLLTPPAAAPAGPGAAFVPGKAPAQTGTAKPYAGTTINVSCWSATYPKLIGEYLPEFEERTGIRVNYDTPAFPVYNQRADLELSTQGSACRSRTSARTEGWPPPQTSGEPPLSARACSRASPSRDGPPARVRRRLKAGTANSPKPSTAARR